MAQTIKRPRQTKKAMANGLGGGGRIKKLSTTKPQV